MAFNYAKNKKFAELMAYLKNNLEFTLKKLLKVKNQQVQNAAPDAHVVTPGRQLFAFLLLSGRIVHLPAAVHRFSCRCKKDAGGCVRCMNDSDLSCIPVPVYIPYPAVPAGFPGNTPGSVPRYRLPAGSPAHGISSTWY